MVTAPYLNIAYWKSFRTYFVLLSHEIIKKIISSNKLDMGFLIRNRRWRGAGLGGGAIIILNISIKGGRLLKTGG